MNRLKRKIHVKGEYCAGPNCDCEYRKKNEPHEYTCALNLNQAQKKQEE
jgi:hypothetical protein